MAKDTFYFTHDFNSRQDAKIKRLMMKHGLAGYGLFWAIIEDLYNNANALPTDYDSIAYDLHTDSDIVKNVVEGFGLFVVDGNEFGSLSVQKRLDDRAEKSKKARDSANKRWKTNANALPTHCDPNAIKERKGKEKKGNEIKKKTPVPEYSEFQTYVKQKANELGYEYVEAKVISKYQAWKEAGWVNGNGRKIGNWKSSILNTIPHILELTSKKKPLLNPVKLAPNGRDFIDSNGKIVP